MLKSKMTPHRNGGRVIARGHVIDASDAKRRFFQRNQKYDIFHHHEDFFLAIFPLLYLRSYVVRRTARAFRLQSHRHFVRPAAMTVSHWMAADRRLALRICANNEVSGHRH